MTFDKRKLYVELHSVKQPVTVFDTRKLVTQVQYTREGKFRTYATDFCLNLR